MRLTKKSILYIILGAFIIQLLFITYNHWTGFAELKSIPGFITRLAFGTFFASGAVLAIAAIDITVINFLERRWNWKEQFLKRFTAETSFVIITGGTAGAALTTIVHLISNYKQPLEIVFSTNIIASVVINIIIVAVMESWLSFKRSQELKVLSEKLEKENTMIRFDVLKSQLNPHFLFNSLNVLSSLISREPRKAQNFVDEFSSIYRYILEVIDKPVVEFRKELEFAKSYLFLQKIRFDSAVDYNISVDPALLDHLIPPLALQTILENAFKHNAATEEVPLAIDVTNDNSDLIITNNYQPKTNPAKSTKIGLDNLKKRYELICDRAPLFKLSDKHYTAVVPLIKPE